MADTQQAGYLSIGEVLGLLLEDFPDVTISKIRFLESQGLISPERTPSGYRKFYDADVELLRVILTEQRHNYLPLRVIKDRLENGEIDPTGEHLRPDDETARSDIEAEDESTETGATDDDAVEAADVPATSVRAHPASGVASTNGHTDAETGGNDTVDDVVPETAPAPDTEAVDADEPADEPADDADAALLPGVLLDRAELCAMIGMTDGELDQLENFGIVAPRDGASPGLYGDEAVEIAKPACEFLRAGVDARHLRNWRTSAEREASLYEQLVTPRFRQRNPESHAQALNELRRLDELGGSLRAAMTRQALRRHFES